jgi:ATP-dependent RNA helicase RhlB
MKFSELPLHPHVMNGIDAAGFTDCMPVQEKVLPSVLAGKDVMVQSKTGSGKTAVFLVAILQKFVFAREQAKSVSPEEAFTIKLPVALIVSPTRELAVQIEEDARTLSSGIPDFRIGCFYGGVGYVKQDKQIAEGIDLIIGTPGRLLDYQQMHKIDFRKVDTFVLDEADRMFDMGFYPDVQKMFSLMVAREKRQTMLFSATLGTKVRNLAWEYMNQPEEIEVQPEEITVKLITQELYHISKAEKFGLFLRLISKLNPANGLIFTNTKAKAVEIAKRLVVNGFQAQYIMGDLPQSKRLQVINRMKRGELRFLVATDVAARGLQIDDLELVVNYDIPEDFESYVHRIGRTARAGKSGKAVTLACEQFVYGLEAIENYIQMKIPVVWPTEEALPLVEDKSASMRFRDLVDESEYAGHGYEDRRSPSSKGRPGDRGQRRSADTGSRSRAKRPHKPEGAPAGAPRRKDGRPAPTERKGGTAAAGAGRRTPTGGSSQRKSYSDIQKMDFEERMAYYKQAYKADGETGIQGTKPNPAAVARAKKQPHSPSPAAVKGNDKPQMKATTSPKQVQDAIQPEPQPEKKKKAGLLARLFKRHREDV